MRVIGQRDSKPGQGEGGRRDPAHQRSPRRQPSDRLLARHRGAAARRDCAAVGIGLYLYAPRSAELARGLSGGDQGPSIDVGMVDDDAAREIVADFEKQEEARKAEEARKEEESLHPPGQSSTSPRRARRSAPTARSSSPSTTARSNARRKNTAASRTTRGRGTPAERRGPRSRRSRRGTGGWRCERPISVGSCAERPAPRARRRAPDGRGPATAPSTRGAPFPTASSRGWGRRPCQSRAAVRAAARGWRSFPPTNSWRGRSARGRRMRSPTSRTARRPR